MAYSQNKKIQYWGLCKYISVESLIFHMWIVMARKSWIQSSNPWSENQIYPELDKGPEIRSWIQIQQVFKNRDPNFSKSAALIKGKNKKHTCKLANLQYSTILANLFWNLDITLPNLKFIHFVDNNFCRKCNLFYTILHFFYFSFRVAFCKGGENSESERHTGCCFVLLAVAAPRLKTR